MSSVQAILATANQNYGSGSASGVYVSSNSYITFGFGSTNYSGLSNTVPFLPKIMITASDNSYQRVYTTESGTTPNRLFRVRYEGTNNTSGTLDSPNMVWEVEFNEVTPAVYDIHVGTNANASNGISGIFSATTELAAISGPVENVSYRYDSSTNTLTSITNTLGMGSGSISMLFEGGADDAYVNINIPWIVTFNGQQY